MLEARPNRKRATLFALSPILIGLAMLVLVERAWGNVTVEEVKPLSKSTEFSERLDDELVEQESEFSGFLELGFAIGDSRSLARRFDSKSLFAGPYLVGEVRWRRLFAQADVLEGEYVGATLWQGKQWTVDLIAASVFGSFNAEEKESATTDAERSELLYERSSLLIGSGLRLSHYTGSRMLRFQLLGDIYKSHGFGATMHFGQQWQLGNWDARALLGVSWLSDRTADYLLGVDEDEATTTIPAIEIGNTALLELGLSTAYPLSRSWVFHTDLYLHLYDGSIERSALADRNYETIAITRIGYVF